MSMPLLTTKLCMPPPRAELVLRPRLVEQLNTGLKQGKVHQSSSPEPLGFARRLTLVSAAAGFGKTTLVAGYLAWAIYVSFNWSVPQKIVAVWFAFPVSIAALMVLVGVHAAGLRAFFPIIVPGGPQEVTTGSKAVATGVGFTATLLLVGAFWGAFAWGIWTANWALLEPLAHVLAVVIVVGAVVAVTSDLYKKFFRSR
jgi:hypothetical protein